LELPLPIFRCTSPTRARPIQPLPLFDSASARSSGYLWLLRCVWQLRFTAAAFPLPSLQTKLSSFMRNIHRPAEKPERWIIRFIYGFSFSVHQALDQALSSFFLPREPPSL
jgi:hypothetical protein